MSSHLSNDTNDFLYKYRSYDHGMEAIRKQQLFLASPDKFEDRQDSLPSAF